MPDDEQEFLGWYKGISADLGLHPNPYHPKHYYDFRGYYDAMKRGEAEQPTYQPEHRQIRFPDEYKLPGHPEPPTMFYDHPVDRARFMKLK